MQQRGTPPPRALVKGGGGWFWNPKVQKVVYKNSQINIYFCEISSFPAMKSGSEEGRSVVQAPPPRQPLSP